MSDSCCGGSAKQAKTEMAAERQVSEAERSIQEKQKEECCSDKASKREDHGCGCKC